jgi:hypothetical protein
MVSAPLSLKDSGAFAPTQTRLLVVGGIATAAKAITEEVAVAVAGLGSVAVGNAVSKSGSGKINWNAIATTFVVATSRTSYRSINVSIAVTGALSGDQATPPVARSGDVSGSVISIATAVAMEFKINKS